MAVGGASVGAITTAVSGDIAASYGGTEVVGGLVGAIMSILGC